MIIAEQLKKTNIAEYILYMWQIEDIIRANNFDIENIKRNIISKYKQSEKVKKTIEHWYEGLIDLMGIEKIRQRGHLGFISDIVKELIDLHVNLLNEKDSEYQKLYERASVNINHLREKSSNKNVSDIEVSLNGLYGLLILKLRKKEISDDTMRAMNTISDLLKYLTKRYPYS